MNFYKRTKSLLYEQNGQTLIDYGLIVILIAIVVIALLTATGVTINNTYTRINSDISNVVQ